MKIKVHIDNIEGTQMAAKITGKFILDEHKFDFTAIAFGRIGGQNVGVKLDETVEQEIKDLGHDTEQVILSLQDILLQGDFTVPKGLKKEAFIDD